MSDHENTFDGDIEEEAVAGMEEDMSKPFESQTEALRMTIMLENGDKLTYTFNEGIKGTTIIIDRYNEPSFVVSFDRAKS